VRVSWSGADQAGWQVLDVAATDRPGLTAARRWAETKLGALRERDLIDTLIVVGELLENAYVHGGGPRQLRIHQAHDPMRGDGGGGRHREWGAEIAGPWARWWPGVAAG
jgi:hypothetical protein